jgi:DNA-directed RNA polymerase specialized sigma24 family protein
MSREDIVECTDRALVSFVEAASVGMVDVGRNPAAYLTRTARNKGIDMVNDQKREQPSEITDQGEEDPDLQSVIDGLASKRLVQTAMESAVAAGDHGVNDVIRVWLDMAAELRRPPTTREVGAALEISHTEVQNRLRRLRQHMPPAG